MMSGNEDKLSGLMESSTHIATYFTPELESYKNNYFLLRTIVPRLHAQPRQKIAEGT